MMKHVLFEAKVDDDNDELFCVMVNKGNCLTFFPRPCLKFLIFANSNMLQIGCGFVGSGWTC